MFFFFFYDSKGGKRKQEKYQRCDRNRDCQIDRLLCLVSYCTVRFFTLTPESAPYSFSRHTGALQIEQSEESDQGKYECVATNNDGTRYSAPANLYVRGRKGRWDTPVLLTGLVYCRCEIQSQLW